MSSRDNELKAPLTERETHLIEKWGDYYKSLLDGTREPENDEQMHFALACRGLTDPTTEHEIAYLKHINREGAPQRRDAAGNPMARRKPRSEPDYSDYSGPSRPGKPRPKRRRQDSRGEKAAMSMSVFRQKCDDLLDRLKPVRAAQVSNASETADRISRECDTSVRRGFVLKSDLGRLAKLQRRVESLEEDLKQKRRELEEARRSPKPPVEDLVLDESESGWSEFEDGQPRPGLLDGKMRHGKPRGRGRLSRGTTKKTRAA